MTRKTIAGLEAELESTAEQLAKAARDLAEAKREKGLADQWARRHVELTDRLLNVLEFNAREGKGYGK